MIKIKLDNTQLDTLAKQHLATLTKKPFEIDKLLNNYITTSSGKTKSLYEFLLKNLSDIICAQPIDLDILSRRAKRKLKLAKNEIIRNNPAPNGEIGALNDSIRKIFDYDKFIAARKKSFAYAHAQNLDSPVCLYCNRQYTFTLNERDKKARPQFDHFFDKAGHPYLALSFYNLVPCCSICNSTFKGTVKFSLNKNIHPLIEGTEKIFRFTIKISAADYFSGKNFTVTITPFNPGVSNQQYKRAEKNLKVFAILSLYNMHKDYIEDLIRKAYIYDKSMKDELMAHQIPSSNQSIFNSVTEVEEFILGTYITPQKFGKRPLSKLSYDIAKELYLIR